MSAASQSPKNTVLSTDAIMKATALQSRALPEVLADVIAKIRENIVVRRMLTVSAPEPSNSTLIYGTYIHGKLNTNHTADIQVGSYFIASNPLFMMNYACYS
jgi:translation elongation factor EF-Ts